MKILEHLMGIFDYEKLEFYFGKWKNTIKKGNLLQKLPHKKPISQERNLC
jgi:hypothetical protein